MSIGAKLLQMMGGINNVEGNSKKGKKVRNFNFRCNLDEIDKIIEEDIDKGEEGPDL